MRSVPATLVASLCAGIAAGCGLYAPAYRSAEPSYFPAVASVGSMLLGAALDEAPEEIARLIRPPAEPLAEVPQAPLPRRAAYKFGLRGGLLRSAPTELDWRDATDFGLFFRRSPTNPSRISLEFGAGYAAAEGYNSSLVLIRSSTLLTVHADLLIGGFGRAGSTFYLLAGGQAIIESSVNQITEDVTSGLAGAAELGAGVGARNGRWDLRGVYSLLFPFDQGRNNLRVLLGFGF